MSVTIQVKAERATRAQQQKNVFATGQVDLVVDGTPMARLYNFRLTYSAKNQKWFINEPSRSIDQINPQTGMQEKRWLSQWQLFPNNKEARDQWMQAILAQVFQQVPDPTKAVEDMQGAAAPTAFAPQAPVAPAAPAAPQNFGPPTGFGAPAPEANFGAPPAPSAPPPISAPGVPTPPRAPSAQPSLGVPAVPAAPGAPPVPSVPSGTGPAFPVPGAFQKPAGPTAHMPNSPSFPLPG